MKYLQTSAYEVDLEFTIRDINEKTTGFAIFFSNRESKLYPVRGKEHFYGRGNENGYAIAVNKEEGSNRWVSFP